MVAETLAPHRQIPPCCRAALRHIYGCPARVQCIAMTAKPHTETMADIRAEIDRLDEELIKLLAARQRCVERAIRIKSRDKIPARVPQRVDKVIDNVRVLARAHHVDPAMVEAMWTEMVEWFIAHEERGLAAD